MEYDDEEDGFDDYDDEDDHKMILMRKIMTVKSLLSIEQIHGYWFSVAAVPPITLLVSPW